MTFHAGSLDQYYMEAAIRLGRHNLGFTAENPSVGALIVNEIKGQKIIVGRGVTDHGGRPHAERQALNQAGDLAKGATAYVTLEPCSHSGKTPPCADALITAGVKRVVIAHLDPDPRVCGQGIARLKAAGIEVIVGVGAQQAYDGLCGFLTRILKKRPFITQKLALSADNYIGRKGEGNVAISGDLARAQTHILRAQSNGVLIGVGTALIDNPMLDCRLLGLEKRSPLRIVLDSHLQIAPFSRLVISAKKLPLWIICNQKIDKPKHALLEKAGCRIIPFSQNIHNCLNEIMQFLGDEGINNLLIEGGSIVAKSFYENDLIDKLILLKNKNKIQVNGYAAPDFFNLNKRYKKTVQINYNNDTWCEWQRI